MMKGCIKLLPPAPYRWILSSCWQRKIKKEKREGEGKGDGKEEVKGGKGIKRGEGKGRQK